MLVYVVLWYYWILSNISYFVFVKPFKDFEKQLKIRRRVMMNSRGILRQPSPTKKRNLTTHLVNVKQTHPNVRLIDHNHVNNSENLLNGIDEKSKYCVKEMNSTKRVVKRLEQLKNLTIKPPTTTAELSPRTKVIVTEKVNPLVAQPALSNNLCLEFGIKDIFHIFFLICINHFI